MLTSCFPENTRAAQGHSPHHLHQASGPLLLRQCCILPTLAPNPTSTASSKILLDHMYLSHEYCQMRFLSCSSIHENSQIIPILWGFSPFPTKYVKPTACTCSPHSVPPTYSLIPHHQASPHTTLLNQISSICHENHDILHPKVLCS